MGIFSAIKDAIFGKDEEPAADPASKAGASIGAGITPEGKAAAKAASKEAAPAAMSGVDVEARLDAMPGADKLNWRTSIVDLMKLVGIDSSFENRKELAHELGDADYSGKAEENVVLHKQVMNALAQNGGVVPAKLLD
ncbi:MAG: DUF3597 domain-containing protein [Erythrobacter sp.]|nr:DUF3597 domain-containing protein [Erythrobacter sp.]